MEEDAKELMQNFVKYVQNRGLLESNFADLPFENSFLNMKSDYPVIGALKKNQTLYQMERGSFKSK